MFGLSFVYTEFLSNNGGKKTKRAMMNDNSKSSTSPLYEALKAPLALQTDFIAPERTVIVVTMHKSWLGGDFTARRIHSDGATILTSSGKWTSVHPRVEIKHASGLPLFTLKKSWWSFSNAWWLELPGGGQRVATVKYKNTMSRIKLEVTLNNAASAAHETVTLKVHGEDSNLGSTQVLWQGRPVAVVRKTSDVSMSAVTMEFEVEVAAGMDQALVRSTSGRLDTSGMHAYSFLQIGIHNRNCPSWWGLVIEGLGYSISPKKEKN